MGVLAGLREVIYNFSYPVRVEHVLENDISDDSFIEIARNSGMSQEDINELLGNRKGVKLVFKTQEKNKNNLRSQETISNARGRKQEQKEIEIEER